MRHEMVIDRLEVELHLANPSQQRHVIKKQGDYAATFVTALDHHGTPYPRGSENATTPRFRVLFQEPASAHALATAQRSCGLASPPKLTMLESAYDTYAPNADTLQLANIVIDQYCALQASPARGWHLYRKKGEGALLLGTDAVPDRRTLARKLAEGWHLADTPDKDAPLRYHGYVKTHDYNHASGQYEELPLSQWRARLEVTLRGDALPTDEAHTLESLNLNKLTAYFRFRKPADDLHPAARYALETVSIRQHGCEGSYKRKNASKVGTYSGQRTKFRTSTSADAPLNEAVRMELRRLNRAWCSKVTAPRRKPINEDFRAALQPVEKEPDENFRATLHAASDSNLSGLSRSTPRERVLWTYGGESHKRVAPNYVCTQHLEVNEDGSISIEIQTQHDTSSDQELQRSSWSMEETTRDNEAEHQDQEEDE